MVQNTLIKVVTRLCFAYNQLTNWNNFVYFIENNINNVVNNPRDTTLTAFFKLCPEDEFAQTLTYDKVPGGTTWNQVTKQETVFEREKNRRSGQSLRSLS